MRVTKEQLKSNAGQASKDATILHLALNDVMNGRVKWFRKGPHKLGITRANGAEGGIVIQTFKHPGQSDYSSAYYWEEWYAGVRHYFGPDDERAMLRDLAHEAQTYIWKEQNH